MKKRLSILTFSLGSGGAERVVSTLLHELRGEFDITLVLMNETIHYELPEGQKVLYLSRSKIDENGMVKLLKIPLLAFKYALMCKKNRIDVSLSFMNRPNYINALQKLLNRKIRVIASERIAPSMEYATDSLKDRISRGMIKRLYPLAQTVIANASGIKEELVELFGIDEKKVEVIHNPVDIQKINRMKDDPLSFDFKQFTFVTVGRLYPQKNHKLLIEAFATLGESNARLIIIGEGPLRNELEKLVQTKGVEERVFLVGRQENPYQWLSRSDCFVLSSDYEGFPNALLEALACGLAVIATDCQSGPREILEHRGERYGELVPVGDVAALGDTMRKLYSEPEYASACRRKGEQRIKSFDKTIIIDAYKKALLRNFP